MALSVELMEEMVLLRGGNRRRGTLRGATPAPASSSPAPPWFDEDRDRADRARSPSETRPGLVSSSTASDMVMKMGCFG